MMTPKKELADARKPTARETIFDLYVGLSLGIAFAFFLLAL